MSAPFSLEPARKEDLRAIRSMIYRLRLNPTGLDWRRFLVACNKQGEIIACGQIKPHSDGSYELASIAVHPAFQGRGIARQLITRLLEQHPGQLYLTCRAELEPFYRRFGFQPAASPLPPYFRRLEALSRWLVRLRLISTPLLIMQRG